MLMPYAPPALPVQLVRLASERLDRADAVLGPAVDGGYYLIGLRRCEPGLLGGLPWSQPSTFAATRARLVARGYTVAEIPAWFDVDDQVAEYAVRLVRATRETTLLRHGAGPRAWEIR